MYEASVRWITPRCNGTRSAIRVTVHATDPLLTLPVEEGFDPDRLL